MNPSDTAQVSPSLLDQLADILCEGGSGSLAPDDWSEALDLAHQHAITPLLYHRLHEHPDWLCLPEAIRDFLQEIHHSAVAQDLHREIELQSVTQIFHEAEIQYLLTKGTPLAYSHYPEPYLRVRGDTDILFPDRETAERAWLVLKERGYSRGLTTTGDFVGYQFWCLREIAPGIQSNLDCHIRINDYLIYAHALGFDELEEKAIDLPKLTPAARGLGLVHAMLLACMHRVSSLAHRGEIDRLIWLYDVHLLAESFSDEDWQEFLRLAVERKLAGTCLMTLKKTAELFSVAVPEGFMQELAVATKSEPFIPSNTIKRWQLYWASFRSLRGLRPKTRMLREHLFPSPDYMMSKHQSGKRWLLPWYYSRRLVSGIAKYF